MPVPKESIAIARQMTPAFYGYETHEQAAFCIMVDVLDRRGLKNQFEAIDQETRAEILKSWGEIIKMLYEERDSEACM